MSQKWNGLDSVFRDEKRKRKKQQKADDDLRRKQRKKERKKVEQRERAKQKEQTFERRQVLHPRSMALQRLGLTESQDTQEHIRTAYKRLILQYHPDKNNSPSAAEQFRQIYEAYEYLTEKNDGC